jgi:Protein of unknown function (DUF3830)
LTAFAALGYNRHRFNCPFYLCFPGALQLTQPSPHIRLTFVPSGKSVLAALPDDEAPHVCEEVWKLLPLEKSLLPGMYSGPEMFMLLDEAQPGPHENEVRLPLPNEILYFYDPGTNSAGGNRAVSEICVVHSRGVALKQHEAVPTFAMLFARIPGDWKHDWTDFAAECRRVRTQGPQQLRIERA